ncbi:Glutathione reductase [hydrothermal vent metagenome]|uniref:glutathione-disulfide reductase n=1 Tax=hydrothermal vent metagenome TaxID=652676 RepID=A0A3B0T1X5_9ZZZZ
MAEYDYDLFVIGAGSGGVRAARIAAGYGARVAVAEEYRVGGTCVIRGCVPKKLFVYASHFSSEFEAAKGYGWTVGETAFDWPALIANKDREIDRLNAIYIRNLKATGVELIMSRATIAGPHAVRIEAEDRQVTAKTILIATGGWPYLPEIPGIEHAITSNEAFHLEALPDRLTVVGGGYIAVEFACIFNGLGVDVSLLHRGEQILRGFDDDMRHGLHDEMVKAGIDVRVMCDVTAIEAKGGEPKDQGFELALKSGDRLRTGLVMYATGRRPNVDGLGLQTAGVELGWRGQITVDDYSKTNIDSIYAVGDVTDRAALTPVAIREGHAFADTVFGGKSVAVDHDNIASAVFSQPEIGTVGLTEVQARERFDPVVIYRSTFKPMKHTMTGIDEKMVMKLVVDGTSDRVIGCHILGEGAAEMAQLLGIAVKMGATKADFDATMALHPTAAEELVTMREPVKE